MLLEIPWLWVAPSIERELVLHILRRRVWWVAGCRCAGYKAQCQTDLHSAVTTLHLYSTGRGWATPPSQLPFTLGSGLMTSLMVSKAILVQCEPHSLEVQWCWWLFCVYWLFGVILLRIHPVHLLWGCQYSSCWDVGSSHSAPVTDSLVKLCIINVIFPLGHSFLIF